MTTVDRVRMVPLAACIALTATLSPLACGGMAPAPPGAPATPTGVVVQAPAGPLIIAGQMSPLRATAALSNGTTRDVTNEAQWAVADRAVATVSTAGLLTVLADGTTDVRATYAGVTGSARVSVRLVARGEFRFLGAVFTGVTDTTVDDVAVDPRDDRRLYATTEAGFFRSTDQGGTWTAGPAPRATDPYPRSRSRLAIDPRNPDRVLFSRGQTLWASRDRGETWGPAFDIPAAAGAKYIDNFLVSGIDGTMWVFTTFPVGEGFPASDFDVYRSTDDGLNWTRSSFDDSRFLIAWTVSEDPLDGTLYIPGAEIADHPQPYRPAVVPLD